MSKREEHIPGTLPRRALLKLAAAGAAAGRLPFARAQPMEGMGMPVRQGVPGRCDSVPHVYTFLNPQEVAFLEAAVDTLIPADELGPGALELGAVVFIDRQLGGEYGRADRMYLQGPFAEGTPEQGYQLRMTPAELVQAGIADVIAHTRERYHGRFEELSGEQRVEVLSGLETARIALPTVPAEVFFGVLLELTQQGFFADPIYGGNRGKASWKMLGFPGIGAMYADRIAAFRNERYVSDPVSIEDLL
jgi:gluconate 2-dehydrogenase gamma chain